ncbi:amidohydrolase family protein [Colletotrichum plurivorum]|uniref:Amidohydrolase family protein n=1 Tax=Colletotrichum plurivorum TaxID=2175906 RepID=A0A8H6NCH6_9PEZI|nr:amidohydrolase family protein [Colletotrichum plurivorum]
MASPDPTRILLKNGTLLIHGENDKVTPRRADLLIEDDRIVQIGHSIAANSNIKVLDCEGKIVSPGFISTHHHLWQTQLKGRHANHTLLEYLPRGNYVGALMTAEDMFWGELAGALEAVDGGITTVVDHAHANVGPEYPPTMIQALATSGIRAVYCYCAPRKVTWSPFSASDDYTSPDALSGWKSLAAQAPFGNGRIQLGYSADNIWLPAEQLKPLYAELRSAGAKIITTHACGGPTFGSGPSAAQILAGHDLLGPDVILSHANFPQDGDALLITKGGAWISATPNTEIQMGWPPVALLPEFEPRSSLGVDTHTWGSAFMPGQMRLGLQHARHERQGGLRKEGKWSRRTGIDVEQAFNLGTVGGARAVGMEGELGRIKVGAKADLVVFDTGSTSMFPATEEDPVAAIVLHSSERDVETVIVGGVIRKEGGKLLPVVVTNDVQGAKNIGLEGMQLEWKEVAKKLLESRKSIIEREGDVDMDAAEESILNTGFMNQKALVD